ncbi:MAG TPA: hypothetical protein VFT55_18035 [Planctomycetota bacterium]|nr:hypothetical protein [Planctomycetota bacterium]
MLPEVAQVLGPRLRVGGQQFEHAPPLFVARRVALGQQAGRGEDRGNRSGGEPEQLGIAEDHASAVTAGDQTVTDRRAFPAAARSMDALAAERMGAKALLERLAAIRAKLWDRSGH